MKSLRIVFNDGNGDRCIFGSIREKDVTPEQIERKLRSAYDYLGRAYAGHSERQRVLDSIRVETPGSGRDEIITLPSGTEITIEAALGDLSRGIAALYELDELRLYEGEIADLEHIGELIEHLWNNEGTSDVLTSGTTNKGD